MEKENFVKQIENIKKANKLDLSVGEDLSIGLMNLISLEEHFMFSYMKTEEEKYLKFLEDTRGLRKRLLKKLVKKKEGDYGETWCISKHLLSTSMRLTEVGTKFLHDGKKEDAKEMFIDAFNIYSMFWTINGFVDIDSNSEEKPSKTKLSKISNALKKMLDCCKE